MLLVERKTVTQNLIKTRSKFGDIVRVLKETEHNQTQTVSKKLVSSKRIRLYCITKCFLLNRFDVQKKAKINEYNESLEVSVLKSRGFFCPGKEMT